VYFTTSNPNYEGNQPWFDFVDYRRYEGGSTATISTPLDKIPVFQRGGSIIPKKERVRRSSSQVIQEIEI
jgi:alpha 1,3-glucosidase